MKQIIFLDDERSIHDVTWMDYSDWAGAYVIDTKSAARLMGYIKRYGKFFDWKNTLFSLDHDLQEFDRNGKETTGYDFVKWLVDHCIENEIPIHDIKIVVHSKNPVGAENILAYWENAKLHYIPWG